MLVQTCRSQNLKVYDPSCVIYARGRIPIDRFGTENDQRCSHHKKIPNGRRANTLLTGITLRQFSTCSTSHYLLVTPIARQRNEFASQASIWASLVASDHDFLENTKSSPS